jgi:DNA-binding MarR family transcriptional regulator
VTQLYDEALKPCGLYATQFTLLAAISSNDRVTITDLSRALIMDRTTLTRNLTPLQKAGWVEVIPGEDKRTKMLSLTRSGQKVLKEALTHWNKIQSQVVKTLGKRNWEELLDNLLLTVKKLNPY